jgi:hypothetical protein
MAERTAQLARLLLEVQSLQAQVQAGSAATKDLSLMSLVPKWAGKPKMAALSEFLETTENTAHIKRWMSEDMIRITTLKLSDTARAFYNATPELHHPNITRDAFKAALLAWFWDVCTDQFHFTQLQTARQRRDESPAVICRPM